MVRGSNGGQAEGGAPHAGRGWQAPYAVLSSSRAAQYGSWLPNTCVSAMPVARCTTTASSIAEAAGSQQLAAIAAALERHKQRCHAVCQAALDSGTFLAPGAGTICYWHVSFISIQKLRVLYQYGTLIPTPVLWSASPSYELLYVRIQCLSASTSFGLALWPGPWERNASVGDINSNLTFTILHRPAPR